ncbi:MAG: hypothetical protein DKINENOH_01181 [bacterium]|nr:hypothetical protein [bacterium]
MQRPSRGRNTPLRGCLKTFHPRLSRGFQNFMSRGSSEDCNATAKPWQERLLKSPQFETDTSHHFSAGKSIQVLITCSS